MRVYCVLTLLVLSACVPVDGPPQDMGFVPFVPDMSDASADLDASGPADADPDAADAGPDATPDDGVPDETPDVPDDMPSGTCRPNKDGQITRAEVPIRTGLFATFKVATDAPVDLVGTMESDGSRAWKLDGDLPGDQRVILEARDPTGLWFAPDFPTATYVTRLNSTSDLLGIFETTEDALLLLGVASPEDTFTSTKLTYDPPVRVLDFPVTPGKTWSTEARVSGTALGNPFTVYSEDYASEVDATGTLTTPFGLFDVMRVRIDLTRTVNFIPTRVRTYAFVSECFGTVANVVSEDDEREVEFTTAAEVRRLAP